MGGAVNLFRFNQIHHQIKANGTGSTIIGGDNSAIGLGGDEDLMVGSYATVVGGLSLSSFLESCE